MEDKNETVHRHNGRQEKGEKKEELTESLAGGGGGEREEEEEEQEMQSIRFSDGQVDCSGLAANQVS